MDLKRIRNAFFEDAGAAGVVAAGTSSTPANAGPGFNSQGIAPFKKRMNFSEEDPHDPQALGVIQSTQHASGAQLGNPMSGKLSEVTHEVVNLFDEERMSYKETRLTPFSGFQMKDFQVGLEGIFKRIGEAIHYNIANTTDPTNKDVHQLKRKYFILKKQASDQIHLAMDAIEDGTSLLMEDDINLGDLYLVICLMNAHSNDDEKNPLVNADQQVDRLLDIAKGDALELAEKVHKNLIPKLKPSKSSKLGVANATLEAIQAESWGEALFWNKLRKTLETMKAVPDEADYDTEVPQPEIDDSEENPEQPIEPEVQPNV